MKIEDLKNFKLNTLVEWIKVDKNFWSALVVLLLVSIGLGYWLAPPIFKGDQIYTPKEESKLPTKPLESLSDEELVYKVYVGNLNNRDMALKISADLKKSHFDNILVEESGFYRLQVGAFKDYEHAVKAKEDLEKLGYAPELLTEKVPKPQDATTKGTP